MKNRNLLLTTLLGLGMAISGSTLSAQTRVTEIDADTLRVTQYKGKPPLKRTTISRTAHPEAFAHYAELVDYDPRPLFAVERRGAPGKSLPRTSRRVSGDLEEVAEFARFEETQESGRVETRAWRGAPGKGFRR